VYLVLYDCVYNHYIKTGEKLEHTEECGIISDGDNSDVWNEVSKNGTSFV